MIMKIIKNQITNKDDHLLVVKKMKYRRNKEEKKTPEKWVGIIVKIRKTPRERGGWSCGRNK